MNFTQKSHNKETSLSVTQYYANSYTVKTISIKKEKSVKPKSSTKNSKQKHPETIVSALDKFKRK